MPCLVEVITTLQAMVDEVRKHHSYIDKVIKVLVKHLVKGLYKICSVLTNGPALYDPDLKVKCR